MIDGRPILASEDIRQIFGEISNLFQVHTAIHDDLKVLIDNWTEDCCIAEIVNKYSERLLKVSSERLLKVSPKVNASACILLKPCALKYPIMNDNT